MSTQTDVKCAHANGTGQALNLTGTSIPFGRLKGYQICPNGTISEIAVFDSVSSPIGTTAISTLTGTIASGTNILSSVTGTPVVGAFLSGTGITTGTYITAALPGSTWQLSQTQAAAVTAVTITQYPVTATPILQVDTTTNTAIISTILPGEGIRFSNGLYVITSANGATASQPFISMSLFYG